MVAHQAPLSIGILQARMLDWVAMLSSRGSSQPRSPALQGDSLRSEPTGKPKNTGVGSLIPSPGDLPDPGIEPRSPAVQADSLPAESPWKPKNTGVGSLFLLQGIFSTQESNQGLMHCRWILYQLSCTYLQNNYLTKRTKKRNLKA